MSCVKETRQNRRTLLLLISFFFSDSRVQQTATLFIFRLDEYPGHVLTPDDGSAEAFLQNQRDRHENIKSIDANKKNTEITKNKLRERRNTAMKIVAAGRASIGLADVDERQRWRQKGLPRQSRPCRSPFRGQTSHYLVIRRLLHVSGPGVALSPAPCRPRVTGGVLSLRYSSARVVRGGRVMPVAKGWIAVSEFVQKVFRGQVQRMFVDAQIKKRKVEGRRRMNVEMKCCR